MTEVRSSVAAVALACAVLLVGAAQGAVRSPALVPGTYTGKVTSLTSPNPSAPWATATVTIRRTPGPAGYASGVLSLRGLQQAFSCSTRFTARNLYGSAWLLSLPAAKSSPCAVNQAPGVGPTLTVTDARHLKAQLGFAIGTLSRKG